MIEIEREPESLSVCGSEKCCICRKQTPFWTMLEDRTPGQQVAICEKCARHAEPSDIPTKAVWLRRERIAEHNPHLPKPLPSPWAFTKTP